MKFGLVDTLIGLVLNIIVFILLMILVIIFNKPTLLGVFVIISPVIFVFGRRLIAKFSGPETALWLFTTDIGVSFAYISIDLFRQDKKFSKVELDKLCNYFAKEFGQEVYETTKAFVLKYKAKKVDLDYHTKKIRALQHRHRALFLYHLFSMALADGRYSQEEDLYLQKIAKLIRVSKKNFRIIKSNFVREGTYQKTKSAEYSKRSAGDKTNNSNSKKFSRKFFAHSHNAYLSLKLNKFATDKEVKKAYRNMVKKYHPDKLNGKSATVKKIAKRKFSEITEAYDLIKKERGMK